MSTGRWTDKEGVVHIYNGILLSYKKEHVWISSNEVDEPRACYTKWSKSDRERQISYINAYTWNLERWYWWSYVQGSKGDTDTKNRLLDTAGEGAGGLIWERSTETYTSPYVKQITSGSLMCVIQGAQGQCCVATWRDGVGREVGSAGRGHISAYGQFMLRYAKNQHNIVKC